MVDSSSSGRGRGGGGASSSTTALVTFRVLCETLGHGEDPYLVDEASGFSDVVRGVPLYTTTAARPWYSFRRPVPLSVGGARPGAPRPSVYRYRFAVFRGSRFHRYEDASDSLVTTADGTATSRGGAAYVHHELSLSRLEPGRRYVVSDVLGATRRPPDVERRPDRPEDRPEDFAELSSLHSRSQHNSASFGSLHDAKLATSTSGVGVGGGGAPDVAAAFGAAARRSAAARDAQRDAARLDRSDGVVVCSAFLPVHLTRSDDGEWTADWEYEALLSLQTHLRVTRVGVVKWRGWHGNVGQGGSECHGVPVDEREKVERCLRPFNCVPVWCEPSLFGEMYNGFCKGVLWPVLHNVSTVYSSVPEGKGSDGSGPLLDTSAHTSRNAAADVPEFTELDSDDVTFPIHGDGGREAELWIAYTAVNRQFADVVVQCFNEGDLVWIHGFHLLVLPSILARRVPMAKMGLFLHTPFPSSEIFRTLWCRDDLLRGMLNADQVGFHLFEYARHFLTSCRRLLGVKYGMIPDGFGGHNLALESNGRHITITSIHAGVAPPVIDHVLKQPSVQEEIAALRAQHAGKTIFAAIDRLESLKGIPLKMLGLERFLLRCPEWVGRIVLIQIGVSAFERGDDYVKTRDEIAELAKKINDRWPGTVVFQERPESRARLRERAVLLRAADVCMVTSIRDGLNLIPLEFAHAHGTLERGARGRGLVVLSEFSSATRVMRGALHVNPWKVAEIACALHQALTMDDDERGRRIACLRDYVGRVTTQRWALAVMLDLKGVHKNQDVGHYAGAGLGLGYRLLGMECDFISLDTKSVVKAYRNSRSRLILVDYGGTILANDNLDTFSRYAVVTRKREYSTPDARLIDILKELCADTKNTVFVVSGKERHFLVKTLGDIPNLGLAAEHGMFLSWPGHHRGEKRRWETTVPEPDDSWRPIAKAIMEVYTSRTHGSYIEETEMKVLWQYRDADPEFGYLQSRELEDHLSNVLRPHMVDVLHGGMDEGGFVEVRPKGVNKGVLATLVLQSADRLATRSHRVDMLLAVGDDHCDEPLLSVVRQIGHRQYAARRAATAGGPSTPLPSTVVPVDVSFLDPYVSPDLETFTVTVGKKPSAAANYVNDVEDVLELLESLNKTAARDQRYYSSYDLAGLHRPLASGVPLPDSFFKAGYNETISAGLTRSMSMSVLGNAVGAVDDRPLTLKVTKNLGQYLDEIQGDEEEDPFFF